MLRSALLVVIGTIGILHAEDGAALYKQRCSGCHEGGVGRAPKPDALKLMSPEGVQTSLTSGMMMIQGILMTTAEVRAVSEFVTGKAFGGEAMPKRAFCTASKAWPADPFAGPNWNGWGGADNRRSQPAAMAGLSAPDVPKLKLKWAFGIPGTLRAYSQPAIAGGRLFVGTGTRNVYAMDASSGCVIWSFEAESGVRTAITLGRSGNRWAAYFGDQIGEAYAVDAASGELIWKTRVENYPGALITGSPALFEGRLYVPVSSGEEVLGAGADYECCKFRGSVSALDAATGKVIWKSYTIPEEPRKIRKNARGVQQWGPSGAGVWSSPTIDAKRRAIYVATGDSYSDPAARTSDAFLAFDMQTGRMLWSRQLTAGDAFNVACGRPGGENCPEAKGPDVDFGSSPMLVNLANGKRALVAGQKSGVVHAVDPDQQGEVLWQVRIGHGSAAGGVQWGSAADDQNVYVALSDVKTRRPASASAANKTVFGGYGEYDPSAGGGMFALRLATGEKDWQKDPPPCGDRKGCSPAQSAAVTLIPGVVFSGDLGGRLRAYSTKDGSILWEVETAHDFETVNGVKANGGAMDGPGPVIAGGMLYVNSGYGFNGGMPGNVLLAFSIE
ncbi:MAG: PQQ-binding-like beta-propeller repeat protein [Acidobacteriia bacterium]|nr:PQQ-binding-like beta-propeller repeat protein [Terriglobia bacterium]